MAGHRLLTRSRRGAKTSVPVLCVIASWREIAALGVIASWREIAALGAIASWRATGHLRVRPVAGRRRMTDHGLSVSSI
jgi:hypothetical protein